MSDELLVGAHMSITGGIYKAFDRGQRAGCRTLQVFLKNNTRWESKALVEEDRLRYREAQARTGIGSVVAHSSYLINLASPDPELRRKSLDAFVEEMERARYLGISFVIIHPGSHRGSGEGKAIARVAAALNRAFARAAPPVGILLENTAGQGSSVGHRFEQLAGVIDRVREDRRLGICVDTCHAFAAGYDVRTAEGYDRTIDRISRLIGLDRVQAFHVNDCRKDLGSRVDRHAHIGKGFLGLEPFRCLINDPRFAGVPKILETPKGEDLAEDRMNLATLRSLRET